MLKLNTSRTFWAPVPVHFVDEDNNKPQKGKFRAKFKVVSTNEILDEANKDKRMLDLILLEVADLELTNEQGEILQGEALLEASKADPSLSSALLGVYDANTSKKNLKQT